MSSVKVSRLAVSLALVVACEGEGNVHDADGVSDDEDDDDDDDESGGDAICPEPTVCAANSHCGAAEVCAAGQCVDAWAVNYRARIDRFTPDGCEGIYGPISVQIRIDGAVLDTWESEACPAELSEEFLYRPGTVPSFPWWYGGLWQDTVCFRDDAFHCLSVPVHVLHEGRYGGAFGTGEDDDEYYLELTFVPEQFGGA